MEQVRVITVFTVFRLLTDFVCLYSYEFGLSLCKIVRSSVILLLPLLDTTVSTGREKVWVTEDTMGIQTLVTDLFGTRSEVRLFLSPATEVSGVVWETEVGIPTQRVRY